MEIPGIFGTPLGARRVNPSADLDEKSLQQIAELTGGRLQSKKVGGIDFIDDSYNASPVARTQSLDRLASLPADGRKIFAAGDMLELGSWSEDAHREVGEQTARHEIDLLVAVGDYAEFFAAGAVAGGMTAGRILCFGTSEEAGRALAADVRAGDLVLVKGSRGVHMERIIEALKQREPVARQSAED